MLLVQLLERMAIIALAAYIYSHSKMFRKISKEHPTLSDRLIMLAFFSAVSITGTYTGINVEPGAIANTRPIGAIVAGYVGGPLAGLIVGLISGAHRFYLGGFTAFSCGISTIVEGLVGGFASRFKKGGDYDLRVGFLAGVTAEILQVLIILAFSKPFVKALELEQSIAVPMVVVNSIGVVIFINIMNKSRQEYKRITAVQSQKALSIAKKTINYMRKGLNKSTARNVAEIIFEMGGCRAVFLADEKEVLDYCGEKVDTEELKPYMASFYSSPESKIISLKPEDGGDGKGAFFFCTPIVTGTNDVKGILGFKLRFLKDADEHFVEFAKEICDLLSTQIELNTINKLENEKRNAELKALRAQIHPHFLFNTLNTISSYCRANPEKARELITDLASYFRKTLRTDVDFVPLSEEIELVNSYISIEKARFGSKLTVHFDIPQDIPDLKIPVFTIQPLVENAIKHGIYPLTSEGSICIKAVDKGKDVEFIIEDSGVGFSKEKMGHIKSDGSGIGLKNINNRLRYHYGNKYFLNLESIEGKGTKVSFLVPKEECYDE